MNFSILFDDVVSDEYGTWSQIRKEHVKNPSISALGSFADCASENIVCGCRNYRNKAEYYIDFYCKK